MREERLAKGPQPLGRIRDELAQPVLRQLLALAAVGCLVGWIRLSGNPFDAALLMATSLGTVLVIACYRLSLRSTPAASLLLVTGAAAVVFAAGVYGGPSVLVWLALPVAAAGALYGPPAAALAGVAAVAVAAPVHPAGLEAVEVQLLLALAACLTLSLRPLHELLHWSWRNSLQITSLLGQLRDERGRLNRTIKDLDASYRLLEQTNRQLVLARQEADMLRDLRNRFATNLSHELRTPLNVIMGFSQLVYLNPSLYGYPKWNEVLRHDLAEIQRNASYLAQLIDDIVDLARVDALRMPVHRESSRLPQVIENVVETLHCSAQAKGLAVACSCPADLPPMMLDPVRISQVLYNLLSNAIRYTTQGTISISVDRGTDEVVVSVADTGPGIPPEEAVTIFNEFHQVARPKDSPEQGKGLGLAIAKRFVQLHGGRIWVESAPGLGATFSFSLPLGEVHVTAAGRPSSLPAPRQRAKPLVLVLDDDGSGAAYLSRRIEGYDFRPRPADEAEAPPEGAVAVIANTSGAAGGAPAPDLRGPEEALRIDCDLPSSRWLVDEGQFAAVVAKPVTQEALQQALERLLAPGEDAAILVVDDDRGFVQMVARTLQAMAPRHRVTVAYGAREALRKMRRHPPDLLLTDLLMPGMSGFDLAREMRADPALERVRVVAITAATPGEDLTAAGENRFTVRRQGPFRPGELVELITSALRLAEGATVAPEPAPGPPRTALATPA